MHGIIPKPADVIEEEAGVGGVRFYDQRVVFELIEVLFDLIVFGFGMAMDPDGADGNAHARGAGAGQLAVHVDGVRSLNAFAGSVVEINARVLQGNWPVSILAVAATEPRISLEMASTHRSKTKRETHPDPAHPASELDSAAKKLSTSAMSLVIR